MPSLNRRRLNWKDLTRRVWKEFWEDRVLDQSAMMSFYFFCRYFRF